MKESFGGDKKQGKPLFSKFEQKLVKITVPKIPKWIETYHLTYATIPWSLAIILSGFLASRYGMHWLWLSSVMIVFQYLTDLFDGALGRHRDTGLIKWGYYMDHFLDYIFLCSILISYLYLVPCDKDVYQFYILAVLGAFMVNSYLAFAATNKFRISYFKIGPTEVRIVFIIVNTLFIFFGKTYLAFTLPIALVLSTLGLIVVVYRTGKQLWQTDMENKKK